MKPFTLHAVSKFRNQLETRALQELARAMEQERQLREVLETTSRKLEELYAGLQRDKEHGTTVDRLIMFDQRIDLVQEELHKRKKALEKQRGQVAKKRQHLLQASKNRKIIEKLEEQQNAAYKKHLDKLEAGMLDEIAVLSHEHKKSD
ncbi:flagellar export protein FliJ [Desulfobulbus rhabdoformis]|uniref:flagellar export protein FliJ n=1 Tax=Desulfobulbus rhabdoformis TaxID=34032 RepID=UPI001962E5D7|nr:flagellar export protein FliJ [Desulfobulbus rhabdoformis]MBM9615155.1 flagellar export protein FliJ [Desulfobulbus rhabdoformis]